MINVSEALNEAADLLERDGWIQGRAHKNGGHCVIGAIGIVTGYHLRQPHKDTFNSHAYSLEEEHRADMDLVCREFAARIGKFGGVNIPLWNDDPLRTAEEVVKTVRAAAAEGAA